MTIIPEWIPKTSKELKPVKNIDTYARNLFPHTVIFYKRRGVYAECLCSECGSRYEVRTESTGDPFLDDAARIEKPKRDMETKCRSCHLPATYAPAGKFKTEWRDEYILVGQKITDDRFVFRTFYAMQIIRQNQEAKYTCDEERRIFTEKGKKPVKYENHCLYGWMKATTGDHYAYHVHPQTWKQIKKTGMYKYVPENSFVRGHYRLDCWVLDYYIAAARYPDMEMITKLGMDHLAFNLTVKNAVNFNPRGKEIHDRLRINKERLPDFIEKKGDTRTMRLYQIERRAGKHWTDEEFEIIEKIFNDVSDDILAKVLKYLAPVRLRNYLRKKKAWYKDSKDRYKAARLRREYFDYIVMRERAGYDMTDDIILYPKDIHRRHQEMVIESENIKADARKKEALEKFPNIEKNYKKISDTYSATAAGYIIRPAKDAAEIITEGRVLHHCVGAGDTYLAKHNKGKSFILFLRSVKEPDTPYITIEIEGEKIIQWYGAYDDKPNKKYFDGWLNKYVEELKKHNAEKTKRKATKTA